MVVPSLLALVRAGECRVWRRDGWRIAHGCAVREPELRERHHRRTGGGICQRLSGEDASEAGGEGHSLDLDKHARPPSNWREFDRSAIPRRRASHVTDSRYLLFVSHLRNRRAVLPAGAGSASREPPHTSPCGRLSLGPSTSTAVRVPTGNSMSSASPVFWAHGYRPLEHHRRPHPVHRSRNGGRDHRDVEFEVPRLASTVDPAGSGRAARCGHTLALGHSCAHRGTLPAECSVGQRAS